MALTLRGKFCKSAVEAVGVRFELTMPFGMALFKSAGLNHSPTLPFLLDLARIELAHPLCKSGVLPLNYRPDYAISLIKILFDFKTSVIYINNHMDGEKFQQLVEKIQQMKKSSEFDLSTEEDLSIAIMNLISLEEHLFFTAEKTGKDDYFDLMNEVRETRKELLAKIINKYEGETWCAAKHLLAAAMRLIEVGAKFNSDGKKNEAKKIFDKAYKIYSLFWGLRLKLISIPELKTEAKNEKTAKQAWTIEDIVNKLVDCCDE